MEVVALRRTLLQCVLAALTLAAAYGIAGRLSLLLATPPGYATALWPPSGLALAGVLLAGPRVWPGIWLGSFMVNIGTAFDSTNAVVLLTSVAIPTSIGGGAVVQAVVGASLVRRCIGFPNALTRPRDIGAFLVLGGPVSCLIGATVGVTALAISGQIPWAMYPIQWGTWWVGDTLGVLITAPLVLSWLAEPREIWRRRRISVALPLVGVLALAVVIFGYTRAQEWERLRLLFEGQAKGLAHTVRTRLDDYLEVLHGIASFYTSTPEMGGQALHTFVQRSLARYLGLQALAWDLHLPGARRTASEEDTPGQRYRGFQIAEQNVDGQLVRLAWLSKPISDTSVKPNMGNEWALGFDMTSAPDYHEALRQASDTGQPTASGRLTLVQKPGHQFGLLVFLPIYGPGLPHATVEERRQNLRGHVTGVFRIDDMVEASLQGLDWKGIMLRIEDEAAPVDQRVLYDSRWRAAARSDFALHSEPGEDPAGMHWKTTVELAGRRLGLHFTPTLGYLAARQSLQPWAVLGGGLVFTSLLGTFLMIVTGRAIVIKQLMVDRTAQLLEAQEAERRRIAHELHDEAGQLLTSVHLALAEAVSRLPPRFCVGFDQVRGHLDDIEAQLRRLSHELRPTILDDLGLVPALRFFVEGVTARTGLHICMDSSLEGRLAPHVETALYRIMQEGMTNVTKHAAATHVQLQLRRDAQMVHARLQDDGVGFAVDQEVNRKGPRGLGLLGIQERVEALGGTLQITSAPGQGTTLQITLPAEPQEPPQGPLAHRLM